MGHPTASVAPTLPPPPKSTGDAFKTVSDLFAGWADVLTFGGTSFARNKIGYDDAVDYNSVGYQFGNYAGFLNSIPLSLGCSAGGALGAVQSLYRKSNSARGLFDAADSLAKGNYRDAFISGLTSLMMLSRFVPGKKAQEVVGAINKGVAGATSVLLVDRALGSLQKGDWVGGAMDLFSAGMGLFFASQSCFAAGTKLLAKGSWGQGWREIELISTDDLVASRDENNPEGTVEWKAVEELFQRTASVISLTVNGREIRTTSEHPFYHAEKGWLPAGDLVSGDWLVGQYGEVVIVNKVEAGGEYEAVYNLRVADWHTYFVGDESWGFGVWAHNADYTKERGFNNGSKLVIGKKGDRWYLPAKYKTARQVEVLAKKDLYGEKLQAKATELASNWSLKMLSKSERNTINNAWAEHAATGDIKFLGLALKLTGQAKSRYVEKELKIYAASEGMNLAWRTGKKGIDAYDNKTGVYYEVLSGTAWNIRIHAKRPGVMNDIWRLISFQFIRQMRWRNRRMIMLNLVSFETLFCMTK